MDFEGATCMTSEMNECLKVHSLMFPKLVHLQSAGGSGTHEASPSHLEVLVQGLSQLAKVDCQRQHQCGSTQTCSVGVTHLPSHQAGQLPVSSLV